MLNRTSRATASRHLTVAGAIAALASTFVAMVAVPVAAQDIDLSNIDAGIGGFVINGQAANDWSGHSVSSAGDVNGDGLADVIVGARYSDPAAGIAAGRSYVVFGKPAGANVDLSAVATGTSALGFVINGQGANDQSGISVSSAGDVNGDGLADVIVGAWFSDPLTGPDAGRSYVVFGKTGGGVVDLSAIDSGSGGFVINGQGPANFLGRGVSAAGDVNADGLADVIVGAGLSDAGSVTKAGRTYVVFGKTSSAAVDLSVIDAGIGGFVINGESANDYSGWSFSLAGDVNGDGLADLFVGAFGMDPLAGRAIAGGAYVVFGKTGGADVELSDVGNGTGGFVIYGQAAGDYSAQSLSSAGDVNGDGLADVIVGAARSDPAGKPDAGRSYVVFGKTSGTSVDLLAVDSGEGGFVINGQATGDQSGRGVSSAGDVNGDGLADVIVGSHRSDPATGGSGDNRAGRSYVVLGKTGTADVELSAVDAGVGGFVINGQAADDRSGYSVSSAGDVNGDGRSDLIVGAIYADPAGFSSAGRSYVVFSPLTPASSGTYRAQVASGNPDRQGIGVHRFGDDDVIFPDSRAWVDFNAGSGPGLASSSEVTATITRNDSALDGFNPRTTANVQWQFTTNRTAWTTCRVTVRYTDAEIAGLTEGSLVLYKAPTAAGPFMPAANFTLTPTRNEAAGEVSSLPAVFVLSTAAPGVFILDGDANDDGEVDIADVTAIHNDLAGIASLTPDGVANLANIGGVSVGAADAILDHLANGASLP